MGHHLTLKEIAQSLHLSVSTVSRALRDDPTIASSTRNRVQEYASRHHYHPNTLAASLRKKQSNIIGVVIPEIINTFFSLIIEGMESVAEKNHYSLIIIQTNENYEKEVEAIHTLLSTRVAGILISLAKTSNTFTHIERVIHNQVPILFFDRICTGVLTDKVVVTDYKGAYQAVEYLIHTGCKRIAFFGSESNLEFAKNRKKGYFDALRANQIPVDETLVFNCDTGEEAKLLTEDLLSNENPPDAILTINDSTAAGVLYSAKKIGIKIPEELSICGFGNSLILQYTDPTITSVDQFPYEIGRQSMEVLINKIKNPLKYNQITNRVINTALVLRESTRSLNF